MQDPQVGFVLNIMCPLKVREFLALVPRDAICAVTMLPVTPTTNIGSGLKCGDSLFFHTA